MSILIAERHKTDIFINTSTLDFLQKVYPKGFTSNNITVIYSECKARYDENTCTLYLSYAFSYGPVNIFDGKSFENPDILVNNGTNRRNVSLILNKLQDAQIAHFAASLKNSVNFTTEIFVSEQLVDFIVSNPGWLTSIKYDFSDSNAKKYIFTANNGYSIEYVDSSEHGSGYDAAIKKFYMDLKFHGISQDLQFGFKGLIDYLKDTENILAAFKELRERSQHHQRFRIGDDCFDTWTEI